MAQTETLLPKSEFLQNICKNSASISEDNIASIKKEVTDTVNEIVEHLNKEYKTNGDIKSEPDCEENVSDSIKVCTPENNCDLEDISAAKTNDVLLDEDDNAVDIEVKVENEFKEEVENDPNFAVICSFLNLFGPALEINYSIEQLKIMFEDYSKVRSDLTDLHIKLLRKRRKYINKEKWEIALVRFCLEYSANDSWELERVGYKNAKLSLRLRIFVRLLEAMFDHNQKFKSELNGNTESTSMRLQAFGRDITGFSYWYQLDNDLNFRLYKEEPDEDSSWSLVSKNLTELSECIEDLQKKSLADLRTDSISNSDDSNSQQAMLLMLNSKVSEDCNPFDEENIKNFEVDDNIENNSDNVCNDNANQSNQVDQIEEQRCTNDNSDCSALDLIAQKDSFIDTTQVHSEIATTSILNEDFGDVDDQEIVDVDNDVSFVVEKVLEDVQSNIDDPEWEITNCIKELLDQLDENSTPIESVQKPLSTSSTRGRSRRGRKGRWGTYKNRNKKQTTTNIETTLTEPNEVLTVVEKPKESKPPARKRRSELDKLKEDLSEELTTKRCSRRIQALQEKKVLELQEEQKRMEKEMQTKRRKKEAALAAKVAADLAASFVCEKSNDSSDHKKKRKRRKKKKNESDDEYYQKVSDDEESQNIKKKKKRKRGKGKRRNRNNPWEDSGDSEDEVHHIEDDYDEFFQDDNEELNFDNTNEDEFACEEIDPNAEPVVVRRARTVKKPKEDLNENENELVVNDDKPCGKCGKYDNPHWILLCDKCDDGYHTACLRPPLFIIPTGDWFCPPCEHKQLIEKLSEEQKRLIEELERRELEKQQKKKRWKFQHCEISADNVVKSDGEKVEIKKLPKVSKVRQLKRYPKVSRKKYSANGYVKDEIQEALSGCDDSASNESDDDDDDGDDESSSEESSSDSGSSDSSECEEDELGQLAFPEERERHKKKKKDKHIDVNDYSRSGLKLRSARKRKPINYLFKEFDDMIKSAIMDEGAVEEVAAEEQEDDDDDGVGDGPRSKGKDMSNILKANSEMPDFSINPFESDSVAISTKQENLDYPAANLPEKLNSLEESVPNKKDEEDEEEVILKSSSQKKKKLTNLDFSTDEDDGGDHASDEDFNMAEDDDELDEELTEIEDENEEDAASDSESDFKVSKRRRSSRAQTRKSSKKSKKNRKEKRRSRTRERFLVDSDEEETEEEEESYSDASSEYLPRSKRRAACTKKLSYREDSSTEYEEDYQLKNESYVDEEDYEDSEIDETKPVPVVSKNKKRASNKKRTYEDDDDYLDEDADELIYHDKKNSTSSEPINKKVKTSDSVLKDNKIEINTIESNFKVDMKSSNVTVLPKLIQQTPKPINEKVESYSLATKPSLSKAAPETVNNQSYTYPVSTNSFTESISIDPLDSMKKMNSKLDLNATSNMPPSTSSPNPAPPQRPTTYSTPTYSPRTPVPAPQYQHPYQLPPRPPVPPQYPPNSNMMQPHIPPSYPPQSPSHQYPPMPPHQQFMQPPMGGHRLPPTSTQIPPSYAQPGVPPPPQQYHQQQMLRHPMPPNSSSYPAGPPYSGPPPQHYSIPPTTSSPRVEKCDEDYTLTNLDSFNSKRPPVKPNIEPSQSFSRPLSGSPTQLLNLDSGTTSFSSYPPPHNKQPPPPHYYPSPNYDGAVRLPPPAYSTPYPPHGPQPGGPVFYPPGPPPASSPHHHQPVHPMPYSHPPHPNAPSYHPASTVAPPPPHYIPPNAPPRQQSPVPATGPTTAPLNNINAPSTAPPPPIPDQSKTSPASYNSPVQANYPYPYHPAHATGPVTYSKEPFMIQNILNRQPETVCATKSAPKATKSKKPKVDTKQANTWDNANITAKPKATKGAGKKSKETTKTTMRRTSTEKSKS